MTSFPALRYGLSGRGLLRAGGYADVTVVDPDEIMDAATFQHPHQYSKGIEFVLVNGEVAVEEGVYNGATAGRALRHPAT